MQVAKIYRTQHSQGLTIQNAIAQKKSDAQVEAVLTAFEPASMRLGELVPLFVWFERKPGEFSREAKQTLYRLVKVPMDLHQTEEILDSSSRAGHELALIRARYYRSPELLEVITSRLPRMSLQERVMATDTLAVLKGSKTGTELDRAVASTFYSDPDCGQFSVKTLEAGGNPSSEPMVNVCMRKLALERGPSWIRAVESQGWMTWPLNDYSRKLAKGLLSPPKAK